MGYIIDSLKKPRTCYPVLVCSHCDTPTKHSFSHVDLIVVDDVPESRRLIYSCIRCNLPRVWGLESL